MNSVAISSLTHFAGPVCFGPHTERELFVFALWAMGFVFVATSLILGVFALVFHLRKTINPKRKIWLRNYFAAYGAAFTSLGIGWLVGTGGSGNDYCRTAETTPQGEFFGWIAVLAAIAALVCLIIFVFSLSPPKNQKHAENIGMPTKK